MGVSRVPLTRSLNFCTLTRIWKVQTKGCITLTTWCCLKLQHLQQGHSMEETKDLRIDHQHLSRNSLQTTNCGEELKQNIKSEKPIMQPIMQEVQANISCLLPDALNPHGMWECGMIPLYFGDPSLRLGHWELLDNPWKHENQCVIFNFWGCWYFPSI